MPELWKPNVTVAAIVEGRGTRTGQYLMVEEETRDGLRINQPAGHLEPDESLVDAVIRETLEETAHAFTPRGVSGIYLSRSRRRTFETGRDEPEEPVTYLRFTFVGTVDEAFQDRALDEGIVRALWMTLDEILDSRERHRSAMVMRCVEDHARDRASGKPLVPLDALIADPSALGSIALAVMGDRS